MLRRGRHPHPDGGVALALRARRRPGPPQVREPPAHRLLQDPRRLPAHLPALRGGARPRRRRGLGRQPRPGRGARRPSCSASRRRCSCPRARRSPRRTRPAGTAPTWSSTAATSTRRSSRRQAVRRGDRRRADPPLRPRRHRRRPGHLRPGDPRAGARRAHRARADRRRRAARRHRDRGQGAAPRRPRDRRAGRGRRGLPAVAGRRGTRSRWSRCAPWPTASPSAGPATSPFARGAATTSTSRHRLRGLAVAGAARRSLERAKLVVEPAGAAAVAAHAGRPDAPSRRPRSRCSPAATSTRCCWAR